MFDGESTRTNVLDFDVATAAIKGKRPYQEDSMISSFPIGQGAGFAIIADGIGGHVAGHLASALATTEIFAHLKMQESQLVDGKLDVPFALRHAAEQANKRIAAHTAMDGETKGMGTTLLVPVIRGDRLSWISVGDSPLLLFREGALRQLNQDHSMAPQIDMMVKTGSMSAQVGKDHPDRNTLLSVLNGEMIEKIDCPDTPIRLKEGDILIAATDGLQSLSNAVIAKTLMKGKNGRSMDIANAFLAAIAAKNDPDQDNTTFVVMRATVESKADDARELDSMPVLATVDDDEVPAPRKATAPAAAPAPVAAGPDESKAYYYRGQKYYRD